MPWRAIKAAKRERVADAGYIMSRNVMSTLHHMTYFLSMCTMEIVWDTHYVN